MKENAAVAKCVCHCIMVIILALFHCCEEMKIRERVIDQRLKGQRIFGHTRRRISENERERVKVDVSVLGKLLDGTHVVQSLSINLGPYFSQREW